MKVFFCLFIFFSCVSGFTQSTFEKEVALPLKNESIHMEKVFVHTNKTFYFLDDTVWFKAYIGDCENMPSKETTRLRIELLNAEGDIVFKKNIFIYGGAGKGQFELSASVEPGRYYIRAYTNYMLNFGNDTIFTKEIQVLGETNLKSDADNKYFDVQILPEGGHLLENTKNVIGIKSMVSGRGVDFTGNIVDSNNREICTFSSSHVGLSKAAFFYEIGQRYRANIHLRDTIISQAIPMARNDGVILELDNSREDSLKLILKTNEITLKRPQSKYTLLYHQRNRIVGFIEITKIDSLKSTIELDKKPFFEGVNTVTLLKDNEPISERKFYITKQNKEVSVSLIKTGISGDSVNYKIKLVSNTNFIKGNLSISVLPEENEILAEKQNIHSAFLLSPFVKGFIENPAYYFDSNNKKRKEHLDLLLLTQGWTQYSLDEMVKSLNPRPKYDFELGFKLRGLLDGPLLSNELALISAKDELIEKLYLNGKRNFQFKNLLIYEGDTLKISFLKNSNEAIKTKGLSIDSSNTNVRPYFKVPLHDNLSTSEIQSQDNIGNWYSEGTTALEEVVVTGEKRSAKYLRRRKLIDMYKYIVFDIGKYYEIGLPETTQSFNDNLMSFLKFDQGVELKTFEGVENYLQVNGNYEALLYIDGKRISSSELNGISVSMENVQNIMVQPYRGSRIYQVFTTENFKQNKVDLFNYHIVLEGYDKAKKYYTPIYGFDNNHFKNWIEVDWKPEVLINSNGEGFFKIPDKSSMESNVFFIQGMTENGLLISEILRN